MDLFLTVWQEASGYLSLDEEISPQPFSLVLYMYSRQGNQHPGSYHTTWLHSRKVTHVTRYSNYYFFSFQSVQVVYSVITFLRCPGWKQPGLSCLWSYHRASSKTEILSALCLVQQSSHLLSEIFATFLLTRQSSHLLSEIFATFLLTRRCPGQAICCNSVEFTFNLI